MSEQIQANKKKKGASKKKKKRPVQVLDVNDSENVDSDAKNNSISSSATESSAFPVDTKSVKSQKKKKKGKSKKPATSSIEQPPSVEPVSSPEDETHLPKEEKEETQPAPTQSFETFVNQGDKAATFENGVEKSGINNVPKKRPTAADLINSSEESSDDAETSVTEVTRGTEMAQPAPRVAKRATAVDFMEESTAKESEKQEIIVPVIPKEEPELEETAPQTKATEVVPKEESEETPPQEAASSQEEQDFGGGLEFLGYPNFDAYSNVLLPAGMNYHNSVNSFKCLRNFL